MLGRNYYVLQQFWKHLNFIVKAILLCTVFFSFVNNQQNARCSGRMDNGKLRFPPTLAKDIRPLSGVLLFLILTIQAGQRPP